MSKSKGKAKKDIIEQKSSDNNIYFQESLKYMFNGLTILDSKYITKRIGIYKIMFLRFLDLEEINLKRPKVKLSYIKKQLKNDFSVKYEDIKENNNLVCLLLDSEEIISFCIIEPSIYITNNKQNYPKILNVNYICELNGREYFTNDYDSKLLLLNLISETLNHTFRLNVKMNKSILSKDFAESLVETGFYGFSKINDDIEFVFDKVENIIYNDESLLLRKHQYSEINKKIKSKKK